MDRPSLRKASAFWLKLGFISFGGPAGQIAIMHEFLVEKTRWIPEHRFLHALTYAMILPGPEAQQLATYTGWLMHGVRGGLIAGGLFVLPSMFILLGLAMLYAEFGEVPWVYALFDGLKPAVMAIVIGALFKIGRKALASAFHLLVAAAAFVCLFFFSVPFPLVILGALLIGFVSTRGKAGSTSPEGLPDAPAGFRWRRLAVQLPVASGLWAVPFILFRLLADDFVFWRELISFFTKAALVTFGGAYAVLPYVAQVSVEQLGWLTELEMIDGLALGETTPGPLVMVLVFVGFMAGYNHYGGSLQMGALGLVTTTFYTFLPCFLFIFAGAPIIERTRENERIRRALSVVTAAVVGVILNLTLYLGRAVVFPGEVSLAGADYVTAGWIAVSFAVMYGLRVGMIPWIGVSALFGLTRYLLTSV